MTYWKQCISQFISEADQWCEEKNWLIRLPALIWFVYVFIKHLISTQYSSILGPLNLGIHELGHLLFSFLSQTMQIAGGTLLQILVPVLAMFNFYRQKDFFAIALCFGWLSTNFFGIAVYIADARRLELPLVAPFGGGDNTVHDWEFLLSKMHVIQFDIFIASIVRIFAVVAMMICILSCLWLLWRMKTHGAVKEY
jgi:hypothetical protein